MQINTCHKETHIILFLHLGICHPQNLSSGSIYLLVLVREIGNQCRVEPVSHQKVQTPSLFVLDEQ